MCVCAPHLCSLPEEARRGKSLDTLELALQLSGATCGGWEWNLDPLQSDKGSQALSRLSSPHAQPDLEDSSKGGHFWLFATASKMVFRVICIT